MLKKALALPLIALSLLIINSLSPASAKAIDYADFKPGRIIDDIVFTNKSSMNADQIQAFLNSKVPRCDTQHSPYTGGSGTVYYAPFTCLKDYQENPLTGENNYGKYAADKITPLPVNGGRTAAQIIWQVAQDYGINPQVLIVLLQKEQGLVTDTWPIMPQYTKATGYLCPDTAPCSSSAAGFYRQVAGAGWQLRNDFNGIGKPGFWSPFTKGVNTILYNPNAACGSKSVNIETQATAVLYKYTPYTPNDAAITAAPGVEVPCGAYGNRNFWRLFTSWFGSTQLINGNILLDSSLYVPKNTYYVGETLDSAFKVMNSGAIDTDIGGVGICARLNGINFDIGYSHSNILSSDSSKTFSFNRKLDRPGRLDLFICSYHDLLGWASDTYPYDVSGFNRKITIDVLDNPLITSGLKIDSVTPSIKQLVNITFSVSNAATTPINIGSLVVAGRDSQGRNFDFPIVNDVIIPANGTYTYNQSRRFDTPGSYNFFIANWNGNWSFNRPAASSGAIRNVSTLIIDTPHISTRLSFNALNPTRGDSVNATFTIQNSTERTINIGSLVVAGRDSQGRNFDFPIVNDVIIPANGTYTYNQSRRFDTPGSYNFFIANWNGNWSFNRPAASSDSFRLSSLEIKDNPLITTGLTLSPTNPSAGQAVTASFTITNSGNNPINLGTLVVAARNSNGQNVDFEIVNDVIVPANGTYTYSKTRTFSTPGNYSIFIANWNGSWNKTIPSASSVNITRQLSIKLN